MERKTTYPAGKKPTAAPNTRPIMGTQVPAASQELAKRQEMREDIAKGTVKTNNEKRGVEIAASARAQAPEGPISERHEGARGTGVYHGLIGLTPHSAAVRRHRIRRTRDAVVQGSLL